MEMSHFQIYTEQQLLNFHIEVINAYKSRQHKPYRIENSSTIIFLHGKVIVKNVASVFLVQKNHQR